MGSRRTFWLLSLCFFLSGIAALIYEAAWSQQFALVFGTSEQAVATVLAAYMAGLMAGALVAGKWVHRVRRPLRLYAWLELGIAVSALLVPAAMGLAAKVQTLLLGGLELPPDAGSTGSTLFHLASAFAILLVPTGLMGATLPLLARYAVRSEREIGLRVGLLNTANTLGAASGAILAAFVLLPAFGLTGTVLVAAALGPLIFLAAVWLARESQHKAALGEGHAPSKPSTTSPSLVLHNRWVLPLVLISGAVSLTWEVLWTRLLSHLLGGSLYAFGTMLATFLIGLGLGSAAAAFWAKTVARARLGLVVAQLGVAVFSWLTFIAIDHFPALFAQLSATATGTGRLPLAGLALLPGTLFMGAAFPCAVKLVTTSASSAGGATARVYGWNTLGAIFGAIGTGFLLLPWLKISGTAIAAIAASLALALAITLAPGTSARRGRWAALAPVIALGTLFAFPPATPWKVLRTSPLSKSGPLQGEIAYYGVGRGTTVLLIERGASWRMTTNGLPEALVYPGGSRVGSSTVARWLSLLPVAVRPATRSMMIIGLGAGITATAVPQSVDEVHVVELEPEVVEANRYLAPLRGEDPLADPRLQLRINDARTALMLSTHKFGAIVSQPSHPWTAGASHLYSRELFALVRDRLEPEGVFVQWIGLQFVDGDLLRSLVATLREIFPYVEVYQPQPGGAALFLCGLAPLDLPSDLATIPGAQGWRRMGILVVEDLHAARLLDSAGSQRLSQGAPLVTDGRNLLQTRAPKILGHSLGGQGLRQLAATHSTFNQVPPKIDGMYLVRRLLANRRIDQATRAAASLNRPGHRQVAEALVHLAHDRQQAGRKQLRKALFEDGFDDHAKDHAVHELVRLNLQAATRGRLPPRLQLELDQRPVVAAVVEGSRRMALRRDLAVSELESTLAGADPRHTLFAEATRLRIWWRQRSGKPAHAVEALDLLEPLLAAHTSDGPRLVVLRARLAVQAGKIEVALASLEEIWRLLESRVEGGQEDRFPGRQLSRDALQVLSSIPASEREERWTRLEAALPLLGEHWGR